MEVNYCEPMISGKILPRSLELRMQVQFPSIAAVATLPGRLLQCDLAGFQELE